MRLAPRTPSEDVPNHLFRIGFGGEHNPNLVKWPTNDDDAGVHELVHEPGVLTPLRLLVHRLRQVPLGAGVTKQDEKHHRPGLSARHCKWLVRLATRLS